MTAHGETGPHVERPDSVAIAVWVKTPGFTPAKTRLARDIGTPAAEAFYRLAVDVVREVVTDACRLASGRLVPYWAVAEADVAAHAFWTDFEVLPQGEGGLGQRLAHVYDVLLPMHRAVVFIGADSPQVPAAVLLNAATPLVAPNGPEFLLGPALDGGFHLFGGRVPIPRAVWTRVTYSASSTMVELLDALARIGRVELLGTTFDVDGVDDLRLLRDALAGETGGGAARRALREWLTHSISP
jgi:glycosyltransferase A (GT-A) superfamily protein (DUF2064 family)